ncbi:hypothetical protein QTP88_012977 [Uroleucon formosanum]
MSFVHVPGSIPVGIASGTFGRIAKIERIRERMNNVEVSSFILIRKCRIYIPKVVMLVNYPLQVPIGKNRQSGAPAPHTKDFILLFRHFVAYWGLLLFSLHSE